MKSIIRAAVAVAATTGLMLTVAPAAFAAAAPASAARDFDDSFDQESRNGLATVEAEYSVEGDDEDENTFVLGGGLYDGDRRSLARGGRCAYFEVQAASSDDEDWNVIKRVKQCGYDDTKYFRVTAHDVSEVRVKTCQISYRGWSTYKCSRWYELDLGF
ncbi:hypothetical protein [Streptosporangium sp. NPDC001681]|uniref:hypothetical protein n=1 Tax=Streptosporangium sp. NPDC001681 TaxID=3154395 RepID=UPI003326C2F8